MKLFNLSASAIIMIFLLSACSDDFLNPVKGNGVEKKESRSVSYYSEIHIFDEFYVDIVQDSIERIDIEAEESIVPYILTRVYGNELHIKAKDNRRLKNTRPMRITIHTQDINLISIHGSASMHCDSFTTKDLELQIHGSGYMSMKLDALSVSGQINGSGDMNLSGIAHIGNYYINGSGEISALSLKHQKAYVGISGSARVVLGVEDLLDVVINGSGDVLYHGNPVIYQKISGSGRVIRL